MLSAVLCITANFRSSNVRFGSKADILPSRLFRTAAASVIAALERLYQTQSGGSSMHRGRGLSRGGLVHHAHAMAVDHFPAFPAGEQQNADHNQRENQALRYDG